VLVVQGLVVHRARLCLTSPHTTALVVTLRLAQSEPVRCWLSPSAGAGVILTLCVDASALNREAEVAICSAWCGRVVL
jgi:hypothetical protein